MDPCDQIYTPEEFRCWKVDNLRQHLTMRGLAKTGKEEIAALCSSACKLNLLLVHPRMMFYRIIRGSNTKFCVTGISGC